MSDEDLDLLHRFATGFGSPWTHTWPGRDSNADLIHLGCVELERRGRLKRVRDEPDHVVWADAKGAKS